MQADYGLEHIVYDINYKSAKVFFLGRTQC